MIRSLSALMERNWLAGARLSRACGTRGRFVCFGRVQLSLDSASHVKAPIEKCSIGRRILGFVSPSHLASVIAVAEKARLELDGCHIGRGAALNVGPGGLLAIGAGTYIADGSRVYASDSITIGQHCSISWNVTILDDDGHGFGPPPYTAPITIGDSVWIGCNVTILKGVHVGFGSAVAAGAVVVRSCPPHSLIGGVPARVLRSDVRWTDAIRLKSTPIAGGVSLPPPSPANLRGDPE